MSTGHVAILLNVRVVPIVTSVLQTVLYTGHRLISRLRTFPHLSQAQACTTAHRTRGHERAPLYCVRGVPGKDGEYLDFGLRNCRRLSKLWEFADWLSSYGNGQGGCC